MQTSTLRSRPADSPADPTEDIGAGPTVELRLLDGFSVVVDGCEVAVAPAGQRLVAYVALAGGCVARLRVAGALWPDWTDERALANLRTALWRLGEPGGRPLVVARRDELAIADHVRVDTAATETVGWALSSPEQGELPAARLPSPTVFSRQLLPGWYDDWVVAERARFEQLFVHFAEHLVHALIDSGRPTEALDAAHRLIQLDPLREKSQLALLRVYAFEGSRHRIRRLADGFRCRLVDELGCTATAAFDRSVSAIVETA